MALTDDEIRTEWEEIKDLYLSGQVHESRLMKRLACSRADALQASGVTEADIDRVERAA